MATGVIAALGISASISYTAPVDAKLLIDACTTGSTAIVTLNGVNILCVPSSGNATATVYVGAGQTVSIANGTTVTSVISVLEGT
jgi:hypothetical protein